MAERLNFETDGRNWPNRAASRFVVAGGLRWHVQVMGEGPVLLLLHGTAAGTHSWRDMMVPLSQHFTVVAPDLPGHAFTSAPPTAKLSLPGMASAVSDLLRVMNLSPVLAAGHSAGAAILLRMALDGSIAPASIVSLNGALQPLGDRAAAFFSRAARLLVGLPFVPSLFAWRAQDRAVAERLLVDTGSRIDARGIDCYARLFRHAGHISAALTMMAHWDLVPLLRELPKLRSKLVLVVGANDRAVPPAQAARVRARLPSARIVTLPGLGHLAHEEQPMRAVELILAEQPIL